MDGTRGTRRHARPRRRRRATRYTAADLFVDRAIDAVMRVLESMPVRLVLAAGVLVVAADLVWRVLGTVGVCR